MYGRQTSINELKATTMQKIRGNGGRQYHLGEPIKAEGVTLIPVSRLYPLVWFRRHGFCTKNQKPMGTTDLAAAAEPS
jgi:uncharacterized spore protein YtfJ